MAKAAPQSGAQIRGEVQLLLGLEGETIKGQVNPLFHFIAPY